MNKPSRDPGPVKPGASKGRLAWFPFFAADWLLSQQVASMSLAAKGLYIHMLAHSWVSGPLPADTKKLARALGLNHQSLTSALPQVERCWTSDGAHLVSPRLEEEREKAIREREKRALGADKTNAQRTLSARSHHTTPDKPEPRAVRSRARALRTDDQGLVLQHFEARYFETYHEQYPFQGAKDGATLKRIVEHPSLGNGSIQECCDRIDRVFSDGYCVSTGIDLGTICSRWARYPANKPSTTIRKTNREAFIDDVKDSL